MNSGRPVRTSDAARTERFRAFCRASSVWVGASTLPFIITTAFRLAAGGLSEQVNCSPTRPIPPAVRRRTVTNVHHAHRVDAPKLGPWLGSPAIHRVTG